MYISNWRFLLNGLLVSQPTYLCLNYLFLYFVSLHKSLSQEENLKDQFNHTLSTYEEALKNRENIVSITQQQNEELASQLQQALADRANMDLELQHALEASQAANDKVQKWVKWSRTISKAWAKQKHFLLATK